MAHHLAHSECTGGPNLADLEAAVPVDHCTPRALPRCRCDFSKGISWSSSQKRSAAEIQWPYHAPSCEAALGCSEKARSEEAKGVGCTGGEHASRSRARSHWAWRTRRPA